MPSIQGLSSPFKVYREPKPYSLPELTAPGQIVVTGDTSHEVLIGAFWLVSPVGRGRFSMCVNEVGDVMPNIHVTKISIATPGAKSSALEPGRLDIDDFLIAQQARGFVRVDHLEDEDGRPLGLPSKDWSPEERKAWAWGLFNDARLRQLQQELMHAEGRSLKRGWRPAMRPFVRVKLLSNRRKDQAQIDGDRATLAEIQKQLALAAAAVERSLSPLAPEPAKAPEPEAEEKRGRRKKNIEEPSQVTAEEKE